MCSFLQVDGALFALPVVLRNLDVELLHQETHDIVTLAVNFQHSQIILWSPLKQKQRHEV